MATSFRRVARSCPATTCLSSRASAPSIAAPTASGFVHHGHQRRHSSSKPPVPPDHGSSNLPAESQDSVKSVTQRSKSVSEKRTGAESRLSRRKAKDQGISDAPVKDGVTLNIPMVPPTQHLQPRGKFIKIEFGPELWLTKAADVHLASLFSTYRPISITSSIPRNIEDEKFASIFASRSKKSSKPGPADVIYTLSSAVKALDNVMQHQNSEGSQVKPTEQQQQDISHMRNELLQQGQSDSSLPPQIRYFTDLKSAIDELAKEWRPFNPPPAPVAMSEEQFAASEKAKRDISSSSTLEDQQENATEEGDFIQEIFIVRDENDSLQHDFFTSQENTVPSSSQEYYTSTSSQLQEGNVSIDHPTETHHPSQFRLPSSTNSPSSSPQTSIRPRRRTAYRSPTRTRQIIHAISVKRQRKLKMKKHKYKKLMRKTRTLRRKLDQL